MTRAAGPLRWGAAALVVLLLAVYARTWGHAFVEFDDPLYVTANPGVLAGLSWDGLAWAFTTPRAFVFHPLTWLSYQLDVTLFGAGRAGPFLLVNLLLHGVASLALLVLLARTTGRPLASLAVAALFALHPLQVEPVAWVSGRKEVLAGAFFMLTLVAYHAYARRPGAARYAVVAALAAACLLAKGTLVALPFLLLLLDLWPLRRREPLRRLVIEKLPLLLLVALDLALQLHFEARTVAVSGEDPALAERIPVAILNTAAVVGRFLWPTSLSIVYPTPGQVGLPPAAASLWLPVGIALVAATAGAAALWRRAPFVTVGWLWFLAALGPMSGIVPTGLRVMHDRYAYVPLVGLAILLVFGIERLAAGSRAGRRLGPGGLAAAVAVCAVLSYQQAGVWRDSRTLFDHALTVNPRNPVVLFSRGSMFARAGDVARARADFERALAIQPDLADAHVSLGFLKGQAGDLDGALAHFRRAVALRPDWPRARTNLGNALEARGENGEALGHFEHAVAAGPETADAHYWLALALERRGRLDAARRHYTRALELDPTHSWSREALGRLGDR